MRNKKAGYGWETETERVRRHMRVSPENKLIWLKEINDFVWSSFSPKQKRLYWKRRLGL
jgi:hypothetical protein